LNVYINTQAYSSLQFQGCSFWATWHAYTRQGCNVSTLFAYQYDYAKTAQPIFAKFGKKVAHGPRKNPLDFDGNPDHVTLGSWLRLAFLVTPGKIVLRLGSG